MKLIQYQDVYYNASSILKVTVNEEKGELLILLPDHTVIRTDSKLFKDFMAFCVDGVFHAPDHPK